MVFKNVKLLKISFCFLKEFCLIFILKNSISLNEVQYYLMVAVEILFLIGIIIYTIVLLKKAWYILKYRWKAIWKKTKKTIDHENLKCAKFVNVHSKKLTEEITLKFVGTCSWHTCLDKVSTIVMS